MTIHERIFALAKKIAKDLHLGIKPQELEDTDLFSESTKKRIKENLTERAIEQNLAQLKNIDTEKDWEQLVTKLNLERKTPGVKIYRVAAIAILFISIAFVTFYLYDKKELVAPENSTIVAGTHKAILTLEDGSSVSLKEGSEFKNEVLQSNGDRLEYSPPNANLNVAFNYLTVPRGGHFELVLSDGTLVWLNAGTKLKYPVSFTSGEPRIVELLYGEAYFDVSPSANHEGDEFKVISKQQTIEVVGTEFNIHAYNDEQFIYTTLIEGKIHLVIGEKLEELRPNEQSTLDIRTGHISTSVVDVKNEVAWIKGYFSFKEKSLKEIMNVLSRWYDVDISFSSPSMAEVKFSGLLRKDQDIQDILNGIKNTNSINSYEIKNRKITIK